MVKFGAWLLFGLLGTSFDSSIGQNFDGYIHGTKGYATYPVQPQYGEKLQCSVTTGEVMLVSATVMWHNKKQIAKALKNEVEEKVKEQMLEMQARLGQTLAEFEEKFDTSKVIAQAVVKDLRNIASAYQEGTAALIESLCEVLGISDSPAVQAAVVLYQDGVKGLVEAVAIKIENDPDMVRISKAIKAAQAVRANGTAALFSFLETKTKNFVGGKPAAQKAIKAYKVSMGVYENGLDFALKLALGWATGKVPKLGVIYDGGKAYQNGDFLPFVQEQFPDATRVDRAFQAFMLAKDVYENGMMVLVNATMSYLGKNDPKVAKSIELSIATYNEGVSALVDAVKQFVVNGDHTKVIAAFKSYQIAKTTYDQGWGYLLNVTKQGLENGRFGKRAGQAYDAFQLGAKTYQEGWGYLLNVTSTAALDGKLGKKTERGFKVGKLSYNTYVDGWGVLVNATEQAAAGGALGAKAEKAFYLFQVAQNAYENGLMSVLMTAVNNRLPPKVDKLVLFVDNWYTVGLREALAGPAEKFPKVAKAAAVIQFGDNWYNYGIKNATLEVLLGNSTEFAAINKVRVEFKKVQDVYKKMQTIDVGCAMAKLIEKKIFKAVKQEIKSLGIGWVKDKLMAYIKKKLQKLVTVLANIIIKDLNMLAKAAGEKFVDAAKNGNLEAALRSRIETKLSGRSLLETAAGAGGSCLTELTEAAEMEAEEAVEGALEEAVAEAEEAGIETVGEAVESGIESAAEATGETVAEVSEEVATEVAEEVTAEVTSEVSAEVGMEIGSEVGADIMGDLMLGEIGAVVLVAQLGAIAGKFSYGHLKTWMDSCDNCPSWLTTTVDGICNFFIAIDTFILKAIGKAFDASMKVWSYTPMGLLWGAFHKQKVSVSENGGVALYPTWKRYTTKDGKSYQLVFPLHGSGWKSSVGQTSASLSCNPFGTIPGAIIGLQTAVMLGDGYVGYQMPTSSLTWVEMEAWQPSNDGQYQELFTNFDNSQNPQIAKLVSVFGGNPPNDMQIASTIAYWDGLDSVPLPLSFPTQSNYAGNYYVEMGSSAEELQAVTVGDTSILLYNGDTQTFSNLPYPNGVSRPLPPANAPYMVPFFNTQGVPPDMLLMMSAPTVGGIPQPGWESNVYWFDGKTQTWSTNFGGNGMASCGNLLGGLAYRNDETGVYQVLIGCINGGNALPAFQLQWYSSQTNIWTASPPNLWSLADPQPTIAMIPQMMQAQFSPDSSAFPQVFAVCPGNPGGGFSISQTTDDQWVVVDQYMAQQCEMCANGRTNYNFVAFPTEPGTKRPQVLQSPYTPQDPNSVPSGMVYLNGGENYEIAFNSFVVAKDYSFNVDSVSALFPTLTNPFPTCVVGFS